MLDKLRIVDMPRSRGPGSYRAKLKKATDMREEKPKDSTAGLGYYELRG
jgi:hypothetical protein